MSTPDAHQLAACLMACRLELTERRTTAKDAETTGTNYLLLTRVPASLVLPCANDSCRAGGHDFTSALLEGFSRRRPKFRAEDACQGAVGSVPCGRVLSFVATAEYRRVI